MDYLRSIAVLLAMVVMVGCGPKQSETTTHWFKGNLHTHSYWSDGDEFPEVILDWYKSNDYQFMALSDHNTLAEGEKWVTIREDSMYQTAFQNYLQNYGPDRVEHKNRFGQNSGKVENLRRI